MTAVMQQGIRILLVDDEEPFRKLLERNLSRAGAAVKGAGDGRGALDLLRSHEFDVAIVDITMPGMGGVELLSHVRRDHPQTETIMLTGHATVDSAIEAMKLGAYDYLEKPVKMSELQLTIERAFERRRLATENRTLRDELRRREPPAEIVGESEPVQRLRALIDRVAPSEAPVLISGESGTGKELVARAVHRRSRRADGPFVAINCGALQETLLENELFGHVKGAFTGAVEARRGLFELSDRGTLFIDEVCEMSPGIQKKFLRVLETGEFRRLGEGQLRKSDVRIVAATNRDVSEEVKEGRFREDLYYRLNVVAIDVPPLRSRREDMPLLIRHFLDRYARRGPAGPAVRVEPAAVARLARHDWPGNVRELFNILERALIVSADPTAIREDDIPELGPAAAPEIEVTLPGPGAVPASNGAGGGNGALTLEGVERLHILRTLEACGNNKTRAAMELGISLRSLYRKLEKFDIK